MLVKSSVEKKPIAKGYMISIFTFIIFTFLVLIYTIIVSSLKVETDGIILSLKIKNILIVFCSFIFLVLSIVLLALENRSSLQFFFVSNLILFVFLFIFGFVFLRPAPIQKSQNMAYSQSNYLIMQIIYLSIILFLGINFFVLCSIQRKKTKCLNRKN